MSLDSSFMVIWLPVKSLLVTSEMEGNWRCWMLIGIMTLINYQQYKTLEKTIEIKPVGKLSLFMIYLSFWVYCKPIDVDILYTCLNRYSVGSFVLSSKRRSCLHLSWKFPTTAWTVCVIWKLLILDPIIDVIKSADAMHTAIILIYFHSQAS